MSGLGVLIGVILAVAFVIAIVNRFKETRADAQRKGHGPAASNARGFAYVAMAIGGIVFFGFLIANMKTIGIGWALLLIFLFFCVGWSLLARWIFDKKPKSNEEK